MKLYVVRHGEVDLNKENRVNGRNDSKLNDRGIIQAIAAGNIIKDTKIDIVLCSPLYRTKQTCNYVNVNNVLVEYDDRLMERDARSFDKLSADLIDYNLWYDRTKEMIYTDTEGFKSIQRRIFDFIEDCKKKYDENSNILVITHGDVCKAFYSYFNEIINDIDIMKFDQDNCEIVEYEI